MAGRNRKSNPSPKAKRGHNVWRSYSDMMAGLLLLFLLVMVICLIESQKRYVETIQSQQEQSEIESELKRQKEALSEKESELQAQHAKADEQKEELSEKESELQAQYAKADEQKEELSEKESELQAQYAKVEAQKGEIEAQQKKIDDIIGIKADLIADLQEEFEKNNLSVEIDKETGAITFASDILFAFDKSTLSQEGKEILGKMLPIYCGILLDEQYEAYLSQIIVDGFTDTAGSYEYNLQLSQERALAVAKYLLEIERRILDGKKFDALEGKLTANGRSESNPIENEQGQIDMAASRRVEVKFRLKDEEMITELQNIMQQNNG